MTLDIRIEKLTAPNLEAYARVPIAFEISSRLNLDELVRSEGRNLVEEPTARRWKDYDAFVEERPTNLPTRFDTTQWRILAAFDGRDRVGGTILAVRTPGFDMLQARDDLAVMVDLRVHPDARSLGVGRTLFQTALSWARSNGCTELIVETQDTNVAACRFYSAMGCRLQSSELGAYGPEVDEAKLIWSLTTAASAL